MRELEPLTHTRSTKWLQKGLQYSRHLSYNGEASPLAHIVLETRYRGDGCPALACRYA
jgi:hypothetical protein